MPEPIEPDLDIEFLDCTACPNASSSSSDCFSPVSPVFVSIPGSGGGLPDRAPAATRKDSVSSTPPVSPYQEARPSSGKSHVNVTLSPQTCLQLLDGLSVEQLAFEAKYLESVGTPLVGCDSIPELKAGIVKHLQTSLGQAFVHSVNHPLSCTRRQGAATNLSPPPSEAVMPEPPAPATAPPAPATVVHIDESVCDFYSCNFEDLTVADILSLVKIETRVGGRLTAFFGKTAYAYGRISHRANPYPTNALFSTICDRLASVVPDFNLDRYSCLVTLYRDGNVSIPFHADDEKQIVPDSDIITISVGAPRVLTFQNQEGILNETDVPLPHGSVYRMSAASQATWKHSIKANPTVTAPRISFTFRRLIPASDVPRRTRAPPIQHPDRYRSPNSPPTSQTDRTLLLTDSILLASSTIQAALVLRKCARSS